MNPENPKRHRGCRLVAKMVLLFCILPGSLNSAMAQGRGNLLIIGGGSRPDAVMEQFVRLAGGADSRIVVVPFASGYPEEVGPEQAEQIRDFGAGEVLFVRADSSSVDSPSVISSLDGATGVFLSGGDQRRLTRYLLGTKFLERMHEIYESGGVIGGTSAGAAVMSTLMITGDEKGSENPEFDTIRSDNVVTTPGFGFLDTVILDQHFIARKRQNRLISLVLENPGLLGIGIDEATALWVDPDLKATVMGVGQVVVYDVSAARNIRSDPNRNFSATHVTLHILNAGRRVDLLSGIVFE